MHSVGVKFLPVTTGALSVSEINWQLALLYTVSGDAGRRAGRRAGRPRSGRRSKFFISRDSSSFARCAAVNINVLLTVYKHTDGNILPPFTDSGHV